MKNKTHEINIKGVNTGNNNTPKWSPYGQGTGDGISKVYTPSYSSISQPTPAYANGIQAQTKSKPTQASYTRGAELLIDKSKIESEICVNIMLGVTQLKEGIKVIENKKNSLTKDVWDSDSDESYKEYLENFLAYMNEVSSFFEALSKKIINDAEVFEELDSYINNVISSGANIANWR
ncbi:hypothetical protein [Enterococcus sp. AZ177]|uniref:hypothetical protein n=1 Tax=unclassified Enterococcus TaxID=2608891 RepID=UPI003D2FF109